jgi:hypothetical protein
MIKGLIEFLKHPVQVEYWILAALVATIIVSIAFIVIISEDKNEPRSRG